MLPSYVIMWSKIKLKFSAAWRDPVGAGLIVAFIIWAIPVAYRTIASSIDQNQNGNRTIKDVLGDSLNVKIPISYIILSLLLISLTTLIRRRLKKKRSPADSFNKSTKIGNFTFAELFNALNTNKSLALYTNKIDNDGTDLLTLFLKYQNMLNRGVNIFDRGFDANFIYFHLGPRLMSYGLVASIQVKGPISGDEIDQFTTSDHGYLFLNTYEKWRVYELRKKLPN